MSPRTFPFVFAAVLLALSRAIIFAAPPPRSWPPDQFTPLSAARIAALPPDERPAWQAYWDVSEQLTSRMPKRPMPDISPLHPLAGLPKGGIHTKGLRLDAPAAWYASAEAQTIADRVAAGQLPFGGWIKGMNYTQDVPSAKSAADAEAATFDNDATIFELRFLARVITAAGSNEARAAIWRAAFERGVRYVFTAQYPNGGFPQFYPLLGGYHDGVTFNDDAMTHALELLRDVALGKNEYAFASAAMREEAAARLDRGVQCVLATQLQDADGRRTVWCQQYDPLTLHAAAARNFEPIADCSRESAEIVLFLMSLPDPSPKVVDAVESAIAWFHKTALHDLRVRRAPADTRGEAVPAPGAPPLWARFYEPGTTTPIFGDRDRTIHYVLSEVSRERIAGYSWYTVAPSTAIAEFARWQKNLAASSAKTSQ